MKNVLRKVTTVALIMVIISPQAVLSEGNDSIKLYINNQQTITDVSPVIVEDRTLVPIRVISENLNCDVEWIAEEKTVEITKEDTVLRLPIDSDIYMRNNVRWSADVPAKIINDRTFVPIGLVAEHLDCTAVWDEAERAVYIAEYPVYENNIDFLCYLGIIDKEDLNKGEYITNREALNVFCNISGSKPDLRNWYYNDELAELDYLDDSDKEILLVLPIKDIPNVKLDENITNYETLKYITRMIGDTYGCTDTPEEFDFTEVSQTYDRAYEKGLIDSADMQSANLPIKRAEFYSFINKALFIEHSIGGYAPYRDTMGRALFVSSERKKHSNENKKEPVTHTISVEAVFNDDMSVSWTVPDEYKNVIADDRTSVDVKLYTEDNKNFAGYISSGADTEISSERLIQWLTSDPAEKATYLKIRYYQYNTQTNSTDEEWVCDIKLPDIKVLIEGDELKPGVFTSFERQWVPQMITLAGGQIFKKDLYYMITSYEHKCRNNQYNHRSSAIWKSAVDTNTFINSGHQNLYCGGLDLEDMHIQEIKVDGNAESGFTLRVTPMSADKFEVARK